MLTFAQHDFPFNDAPELIMGEDCTEFSDIWALGCMAYEMMHKKPFSGKSAYEVAKKILKEDEPPELPSTVTLRARTFIKWLL
jgi:serine/threonine protein kinase